MAYTPTVPWRDIDTPDVLADNLIGLYHARGQNRYDEAVTQDEHACQAADLARADGASDELVVAALLHDLGHLLLNEHEERQRSGDRDFHHEDVAARFLQSWYPPAVVEPVVQHVAAKRYLCAVEPAYFDTLSPASVQSLKMQGGPMSPDEAAEFAASPHADACVALRRWDDLAKDPDRAVPPIESYRELLMSAATQLSAASP